MIIDIEKLNCLNTLTHMCRNHNESERSDNTGYIVHVVEYDKKGLVVGSTLEENSWTNHYGLFDDQYDEVTVDLFSLIPEMNEKDHPVERAYSLSLDLMEMVRLVHNSMKGFHLKALHQDNIYVIFFHDQQPFDHPVIRFSFTNEGNVLVEMFEID